MMRDKALVGSLLASAAVSCAAAWTVMRKKKEKARRGAFSILKDFEEGCCCSTERLRRIVDDMVGKMQAGLAVDGGSSSLKMIVSFVQRLPKGEEKGLYYALDLGGTNFRVLRVKLASKEEHIVHEEHKVSIPPSLMVGTKEELFDFIAEELASFVTKEENEISICSNKKMELGFTFSFPVKQNSISSGTLMNWTKGFKVSGMVGKNVAEALNDAMEKKGLNMRVAALINDTVGTLACGRYYDEDVMAAVILGTGSNACYVERADSIPKWQGHASDSSEMVINIEWGNFQSDHLPCTYIDKAFDAMSLNPGDQIFEKLISGMYLGEIVRRLLLRIAEETGIFGNSIPANLATPFKLRSPDVSLMHSDNTDDLRGTAKILNEVLGIQGTSLSARKVAVEASRIVAQRGARLAGAGIVAILKKIGRGEASEKRTVVAIDGALYEHYPLFRQCVHDVVTELIGSEASQHVDIQISKDGSGIGAALLAASHSVYLNTNASC